MTSVYKQQLLDWVANLDVKAETVLDIGGCQDPIKGRTKSWDVKRYYVLDLDDPHYVKDSSADYYLDLDDVMTNQVLLKFGGEADMIFCLEVFDYIKNPWQAFENITHMLKPGGSAWVSFPFIYPHHNPIADEGLRYTEPAIRHYAKCFGLVVKEIVYRRPQSHKLLEYFSEDGFRAASGYDHNVIGYIVRFQK